MNDLLQGRFKPAGAATVRFAANTIFGVAGIFDVAGSSGLKRHDNDFGLTLGRMHVGAGPYLYLPFIGPDSVRDLTAEAIDFVLDPLNLAQSKVVQDAETSAIAVSALHNRSELDGELKMVGMTADDPYATIRSLFLLSRESAVRDGVVDVDALPEFPDDGAALPSDTSQEATPPAPVTPSGSSTDVTPLEGAPAAE